MKAIILIFFGILFAGVAFSQSRAKVRDTAAKNTPAAIPPTAFRMHYDDLFKRNADNSVSPVQPLQINGEIVNTAMRIGPGIKYGGVDIAAYAGHDMLVDTLRGVVIIRKFLK
jgi:hypothetical protein